MNNNNINEVITNLYEALVLVRYPGIAQFDLPNLESTILAEDNRISLLHWLLVQSINVVDSTLDVPVADETSMIKWYSQCGVCTNKKALLGQCSLTEQLGTLVNLTEFINNVLAVDGNEASDTTNYNPDILQNYIYNEIHILPPSYDLPIANFTYKDAVEYIKKQNSNLIDEENNTDNRSVVDGAYRGLSLISKNSVIDNDVEMENQTTNSAILDEFCEVFQSFDICNNSDGPSLPEEKISLDKYIASIHTKFSTVYKTLQSKKEISNTVIRTEFDIEDSPLNQIIQDVVISLENLSQSHNRGDE